MADNVREFKDNNNTVLARAIIPENYVTGGALKQHQNDNRVPFDFKIHAIDQQNETLIMALSEEMFLDYRNDFMANMAKMTGTINPEKVRDYVEPLIYLHMFAQSVFQEKINPISTAELPSLNSMNRDVSVERMMNYYNTYFNYETMGGLETKGNQFIYQGFLVRYEGVKQGKEFAILAGTDFKGIECYCPNIGMMAGMMSAMMPPFMNMGKSSQKQTQTGAKIFGQGKPCDYVEWGSEARYILITPKENFEKAGNDFLRFVSTYQMDKDLYLTYEQQKMRILENDFQTGQMAQAQTRVNINNLQFQQQKLTNMLQQNSQQISAGIMDSWNKKMAADSRISQNFSEAIRGVNTYNTTDGRQVEVSVTADHVYQNQHGDVYGVSGNSLDQDILNRLNWTELKK